MKETMTNELRNTLFGATDMLRNLEYYGFLAIEAVCSSLEIVQDRIIKSDISIINTDISKEEYEKHFQPFFSSINSEVISRIIDEIKADYENIEGDTKNDND